MEEELKEMMRGAMLLHRMMYYYPREEQYGDSTASPWVRPMMEQCEFKQVKTRLV